MPLRDQLTGRLDQELYAEFAILRRERERTADDIVRWVGALTDEALADPLAHHFHPGTTDLLGNG